MPPQLASLTRTNVQVQEIAVSGALEADISTVRRAIKLGTLSAAVCALDDIDRMIDELFEANVEHLCDDLLTQDAGSVFRE